MTMIKKINVQEANKIRREKKVRNNLEMTLLQGFAKIEK